MARLNAAIAMAPNAAAVAAPRPPARPASVALSMFRVRVTLQDCSRRHYTSLFASGSEAVLQALADHPTARSVSAFFLGRLA